MAETAEPIRNIEEVKAMLETTEKGGFRNSIRNCLTVFQCDPLLFGAVAYNLLTDRTDILKPIGYVRHSHPMQKAYGANSYTEQGRELVHKKLEGVNMAALHGLMRNPVEGEFTINSS